MSVCALLMMAKFTVYALVVVLLAFTGRVTRPSLPPPPPFFLSIVFSLLLEVGPRVRHRGLTIQMKKKKKSHNRTQARVSELWRSKK